MSSQVSCDGREFAILLQNLFCLIFAQSRRVSLAAFWFTKEPNLASLFFKTGLAMLLAIGGGKAGGQAIDSATRPNVLLMLVDDMGVMDTSVPFLTDDAGQPKRYPLNEYYRTPSMERLAAQGIRFCDFNAMSVCSPTRICIMTGQNAARHRTTNWINPNQNNAGPHGAPRWNWEGLNSQSVTLAKLLSSNGYRTIHVGKGHFGPIGTEGSDPCKLGFDINVGGSSAGQPGSYYGSKNYGNSTGGKKAAFKAVQGLEEYHGTDTFLTEALTLEAKKHVADAVKANQPFFLYFPQYAAHSPFNSDPRYAAHYKNSGKSEPAQAFATLIEGMDKSLGDMLDHLQALGVAENTFVLFLGDNGSDAPLGHEHAVACAAPLRGKKGSHYEGGTRVPFIAAWAKANPDNRFQVKTPIARGTIQPHPAAVYDLFPTILNVANVKLPSNHTVDGTDLSLLLSKHPKPDRNRSFLMHYPHAPHRSNYFTTFREGNWKVIYHYYPSEASEGSHYQLFNLATDPFEQENLAKSQPSELKRMMQGMVEALEQHDAVYPLDERNEAESMPKLPD
jgi:arylsulfatase A-like enzyme